MAKLAPKLSSGHPDPKVIHTLIFVRRVSLVIVAFITTVVLLAWTISAIDWLMPVNWHLMKANTALCLLLLSIGLQLSHARRSRHAELLSHTLAILVALISFATLYQYLRGISLHI